VAAAHRDSRIRHDAGLRPCAGATYGVGRALSPAGQPSWLPAAVCTCVLCSLGHEWRQQHSVLAPPPIPLPWPPPPPAPPPRRPAWEFPLAATLPFFLLCFAIMCWTNGVGASTGGGVGVCGPACACGYAGNCGNRPVRSRAPRRRLPAQRMSSSLAFGSCLGSRGLSPPLLRQLMSTVL
jgi:hypothetical protein